MTRLLATLFLVVALLLLVGCKFDWRWPFFHGDAPPAPGAAESPEDHAQRVGNAAEAASGAEAIARGYILPTQVAEVAQGVHAFAMATLGRERPPTPDWSPDRISRDATGYRKAGQAAQRHANGTELVFWLKAVGATLGSLALAYGGAVLCKGLPVIGPPIVALAERVWGHLTDAKTKEEDEARTVLAGHVSSVLEVALAALPPGEARAAIKRLPPDVIDAAQRVGIAVPTEEPLPPIAAAAPATQG